MLVSRSVPIRCSISLQEDVGQDFGTYSISGDGANSPRALKTPKEQEAVG